MQLVCGAGGLPWILMILNDMPCTAIVDTRAELSVVSPKVVLWASLQEVKCESLPLIMGEGVEVQSTRVVLARVQYKDIIEHNFAIVESAKHTSVWK